MNSIRVLLSIATNLDRPLHQFNVKEELYMEISPELEDSILYGKSVQTKEDFV
jgi:hypothetical protein